VATAFADLSDGFEETALHSQQKGVNEWGEESAKGREVQEWDLHPEKK